MFEMAEKIVWPVIVSFLGTEEGRRLLMAEAAVQNLIVFVVAMSGFVLIALVRRFDTGCLILIDTCSAFLRVMMHMSLAGIFVPWIRNTPWIIYSPLFFLLLLPLPLPLPLLEGQRAEGGLRAAGAGEERLLDGQWIEGGQGAAGAGEERLLGEQWEQMAAGGGEDSRSS